MTEQEYEAALQRVYELMNAEPGTPEMEELNGLTEQVEAYEAKHYPVLAGVAGCRLGVVGE